MPAGKITGIIGNFPYRIALQRWGRLPKGDPEKLVEELYEAENKDNPNTSGSLDADDAELRGDDKPVRHALLIQSSPGL